MLAPRLENRTVEGPATLGLDDEANSEIADGYAKGSSARRGVRSAICQLPERQRVTAGPSSVGSARTPPVAINRFKAVN